MPISNEQNHTIQSQEMKKGEFSNRPRTTFTEEIMTYEKKKPSP